jgi:hypothetical protein
MAVSECVYGVFCCRPVRYGCLQSADFLGVNTAPDAPLTRSEETCFTGIGA